MHRQFEGRTASLLIRIDNKMFVQRTMLYDKVGLMILLLINRLIILYQL